MSIEASDLLCHWIDVYIRTHLNANFFLKTDIHTDRHTDRHTDMARPRSSSWSLKIKYPVSVFFLCIFQNFLCIFWRKKLNPALPGESQRWALCFWKWESCVDGISLQANLNSTLVFFGPPLCIWRSQKDYKIGFGKMTSI